MEYLVIDCRKAPLSLSLENDPSWIFQDGLGPSNFQRLEELFFEWIFGTGGEVCGVELCNISPDDESFALLAETPSPFIDLCIRPRIWFTDKREGQIRHYLDWEGYFFSSPGREAAVIALSTHMLSSQEQSSLQAIISKKKGA